MSYEYLDDEAIADIAFKAYGNDINQLFYHSVLAVCNLQTDLNKIDKSTKNSFHLESTSLEMLLYKLLSEILYLKDAELFFPKDVKLSVKENKKNFSVNGEFYGCKFNDEIHPIGNDLKAITMHDFYIKKENDRWICHVLIDI